MLVVAFPQGNSNSIFIKETEGFNVKDIRGAVVNKNSCEGYCNYNCHRGYLTPSMVKDHSCKEKECVHYYNFFEQNNKQKRKEAKKQEKQHNLEMDTIKSKINSLNIDGFIVQSVKHLHSDHYEARYISTGKMDEHNIEMKIKQKFNINVKLIQITVNFDVIEKIFR